MHKLQTYFKIWFSNTPTCFGTSANPQAFHRPTSNLELVLFSKYYVCDPLHNIKLQIWCMNSLRMVQSAKTFRSIERPCVKCVSYVCFELVL
jgi:hypothetical protein